MKPVGFELGNDEWLLSTVEVTPPEESSAASPWWNLLSSAARQAADIPGANLTFRLEQTAGAPLRRQIGLVLPRDQSDLAEKWLAKCFSDLNAAAPLSAKDTAKGNAFWENEPGHLSMLPILNYSVDGTPLICGFNLLPSIEALASEWEARRIPWSYQLNAINRGLDSEEKRSLHKNLARIEHSRRVPPRIIRHQSRLLDAMEKSSYRIAEFVGAPDPGSFQQITSLISREFDVTHGPCGFGPLDGWNDQDEEALDAWNSGLHPSVFSSEPAGFALSPFVGKESLPSLWSCRWGAASKENAPPLAPPSAKADIFLSYSTRDTEAAFTICRILERENISCWIAPRNIMPGSEWSEAIVKGIQESKATVLLLSGGSNLSRYVLRELELTVKNAHPIVPVRLEECHLSDSLQFFLATRQWFDALTPPLDPHILRLVEILKRLLSEKP